MRNKTAAEIMLNALNVCLLCYVSIDFRGKQRQTREVPGLKMELM